MEEDDGQFRFSNGTIIRRARFGIKATLYEKWFAELDVDFANNEVEIKDMFMGYRFSDHWNVKMGNFKVPMSMERVTSSKYLMSAERPMPVEAFADFIFQYFAWLLCRLQDVRPTTNRSGRQRW